MVRSTTHIPPTRAGSTAWLGPINFLIWCQAAGTKIRSQPWTGCGAMTSTRPNERGKMRITREGTVMIERTLSATIDRFWKALTDVEAMKHWYFDLKEFQAKVGFEFEFVVEHEGNSYHHLCRVTETTPPRKLAYTWRYKGHEGNSLVTFELSPEGEKTRLKLTHKGLETFPPTAAFARENFEQGWTEIIGKSLPEF